MNYRDFFKEDMLPGGKADKKTPKDFDAKELAMGVKVEMEHTKEEKLAKEIAMDHLAEDPHYYSKLKSAGLADELSENNLMGLESPLGLFPDKSSAAAIVEPNAQKVDKQTVQGTVYPPVENDPAKGPDMGGGIGNTKCGSDAKATPVDAPSKDPTPTDHVTGAMGNSASNPNVLPKSGPGQGQLGGGSQMMSGAAEPQNITIDIAEGKKLLKKMLIENTKGAATAFGPREGFVPAAGDPGKDPHFVKGKRWTVNYGVKTPQMKEDAYGAVGDYNDEMVRQAVKTVVSQSSYNEEDDMGAILAYLQDQGINVSDDVVERMYREEMAKKTMSRDFRKNPAPETWGKAKP